MKIEVTQGNINKGEPDRPCRCPLALALKRATKKQWVVGTDAVKLFGDHKLTMLPKHVSKWVHYFDNNKPVQPFTFELPI